jgi:hypothetical protein
MRGARYGEVLLISGHLTHFEAAVYNTLGLNDCPDALWSQLDAEVIAKDFKARAVILNGPRYFLMDSTTVESEIDDEPVSFGGLQMRRMATVRIPLRRMIGGVKRSPYAENVVERTTTYVYERGRVVYELAAPDGATYVMQSFSLQVDPTLSESRLESLGDRLRLPEGWRYQVRKLDADWSVRADGAAYLIQDDFENSYQRVAVGSTR